MVLKFDAFHMVFTKLLMLLRFFLQFCFHARGPDLDHVAVQSDASLVTNVAEVVWVECTRLGPGKRKIKTLRGQLWSVCVQFAIVCHLPSGEEPKTSKDYSGYSFHMILSRTDIWI